jgi:hypothetical protein
MWALLNNAEDAIEEIISNPKSMTINGITHSRQIFKWTTAELKAVGIVPVTTTGSHLDTNYYIEVNESFAIASDKASVVQTIGVKAADKALADVNEVDEDGDPLLDDDGVQVVTLGLKSNAKNKATTSANGYLQGFDWLIQRKVTANTAIPSAVTTYMAAIRTDHGNICTALDAAADMDAFIALHTTTYNEDGTVNVIAKTQSWTSDANVKAYRR